LQNIQKGASTDNYLEEAPFFGVARIPIRAFLNQRFGNRCTRPSHLYSFFITFETHKIKMKKLLITAFLITLITSVQSQSIDSTALIIIDIQNFYFPGGAMELAEPEKAAEQAKILLKYFRENKGLVVHVNTVFRQAAKYTNLLNRMTMKKCLQTKR